MTIEYQCFGSKKSHLKKAIETVVAQWHKIKATRCGFDSYSEEWGAALSSAFKNAVPQDFSKKGRTEF